MPDYFKGKVYKIEPVCEHEEGHIYIGSTVNDYLCNRLAKHRNAYKSWKEGGKKKSTCFDIFDKYGLDNCKIYLIENVNAESKDELLAREGYYIKILKCVNKFVSGRSREQYIEDNKEQYTKQIQERNKNFREKHRETILEKKKEYYQKVKDNIKEKITCECGSIICKGESTRHKKTKKHLEFLSTQINIQ